jgi:hypothetical protein
VRQGIMADLSPQRSLGVESVVMGPVGVAQLFVVPAPERLEQ